MSELSVFRFAKKASYGWASAAGMYVGHFMAWISAALMLAAQIKLRGDTPWLITWLDSRGYHLCDRRGLDNG